MNIFVDIFLKDLRFVLIKIYIYLQKLFKIIVKYIEKGGETGSYIKFGIFSFYMRVEVIQSGNGDFKNFIIHYISLMGLLGVQYIPLKLGFIAKI